MSKVLYATCVGGVVTADGLPVPDFIILSEGVHESEGLLFLEEDKKTYIPKQSPDMIEALTRTADAIGTASDALAAVSSTLGLLPGLFGIAGVPGPALIPLGLAITQVNMTITSLNSAIVDVENLREDLS